MGETILRYRAGPERHVIPTLACADAWDLCFLEPYIVLLKPETAYRGVLGSSLWDFASARALRHREELIDSIHQSERLHSLNYYIRL